MNARAARRGTRARRRAAPCRAITAWMSRSLSPCSSRMREAAAHQLVVVGLVARGAPQRLDAGRSATLIQISGTSTPSRSRQAIIRASLAGSVRDQFNGARRSAHATQGGSFGIDEVSPCPARSSSNGGEREREGCGENDGGRQARAEGEAGPSLEGEKDRERRDDGQRVVDVDGADEVSRARARREAAGRDRWSACERGARRVCRSRNAGSEVARHEAASFSRAGPFIDFSARLCARRAGSVQKVALPIPRACRLPTVTRTGSTQVNGARATIIVGVTATTSAGSPPMTTQFPSTGRQPLSEANARAVAVRTVAADRIEPVSVDSHQLALLPPASG